MQVLDLKFEMKTSLKHKSTEIFTNAQKEMSFKGKESPTLANLQLFIP